MTEEIFKNFRLILKKCGRYFDRTRKKFQKNIEKTAVEKNLEKYRTE